MKILREGKGPPPRARFWEVCHDRYMSTIHRPNGRRFSCPEVAKIAARALIKHGMNASAAARELRRHLSEKSAAVVGARMIRTP